MFEVAAAMMLIILWLEDCSQYGILWFCKIIRLVLGKSESS